jgi:exosortase
MNRMRKVVMAAGLLLLALWFTANFARLTGEQHGVVRFVLGSLFAFLILVRPKVGRVGTAPRHGVPAAVGLVGTLLAVGGIIFTIHQFEWLGIVLLLYACMRWAMQPRYGRDIILALLLLYWVHPLPGRAFGDMQLAMQRWSVAGAEWLLHVLNVRAWADGFFLYSGYEIVGVPESCSGMRAVVTVLLCTLGTSILLRFHMIELALFVVVALTQVLAMNIVRITMVVKYAPTMPPEWSRNFLHDSLGWFLLIAILLPQIEASAWQVCRLRLRHIARGIAADELEPPERATRFPRFWHLLLKWFRTLMVLTLIVLAVVFAAYKSRPLHRNAMRREVIDSLMETDRAAAERAIDQQLARRPDDREMLGQKVRTQVMRRDFEGALRTFDRMGGPLSPFETTLKSWSLMALGKTADAVALIDSLPLNQRHLPGVAMVRAEYAAVQGDPGLAAEYIVYAGHSVIDVDRVRALFPFLAQHEQWRAIADSDAEHPYEDPRYALVVVEAGLRVNDLDVIARALGQALRQWPEDPRFLQGLFVLASRRPGSEWEDRFTLNLQANLDKLDVDQVVSYMGYCFKLARPDLGWQAYLHLLQLDPRHPDVFYTPAQNGGRWFELRRRLVRIGDPAEMLDIRPLVAHTRHLWRFNDLWNRVPLCRQFVRRDTAATRNGYMIATLAELESREREGRLSMRGMLIYPVVLASQARFNDAHARLDRIAEEHPDLLAQVQLQHAEFYDFSRNWESSYEALRVYYAEARQPELKADLLMVNALLNLNLGVPALEVARRSADLFPGVGYTDLLRAAIWDTFGFKEQALFLLRGHEDDIYLHTTARLLLDTGRVREAERVHGVLGQRFDRLPGSLRQPLLPPPAELTVTPRWTPDTEDPAVEADRFDSLAARGFSPFLRALNTLSAAWFRDPAAAEDPARWAAAGRDAGERAAALHRLAVLAARAQRRDTAIAAARAAVNELPDSPILRRILIALTEGDSQVVAAARAACPEDPDIWLASLVVGVRERGTGDWLRGEVERALRADRFPVGTLVQAGDFLLRKGARSEAAQFARATIAKGDGLVSALMLGLRCALEARDADWAVACARLGIEHAVDPSVFYKAVVEIKTIQETPDADLLRALEYLKDRFPRNSEWVQYLGHVYFQKGETRRALAVLEPVIAQEVSGIRVRSLLLAAEAARVDGDDARALGILERALDANPNAPTVLNNLIYNLAQRRETAPRAYELLPRLLATGLESPAMLDTVALVYLRNGKLDLAKEYSDRALAALDPGDYSALETQLNAAEILLAMGRLEEAEAGIDAVRRDERITSFLDARARRLADFIRERRQRQAASGTGYAPAGR